jgi:predicted N-acetyltransferase YhbS
MADIAVVTPTITQATAADVRALTALRTGVAQHMRELHGEGQWSAIPSKAEVQRQMRASSVFVARLDEQMVGTVRLTTINPRAAKSAGFSTVSSALYLLGLAVAPEYHRMGIGGALIAAAKDHARARSVEALWLDTYEWPVGTGAFYLSRGFRRVGPREFEWLVD